ncbi:MAG: zinc transporter ZntB [Pseudomonadota bacterium]
MSGHQQGQDGLVNAYRMDGQGGASALDWQAVDSAVGEPARPLWVHLNRKAARARKWLTRHGHLDPLVAKALLEEDTRPRFTEIGPGALLNLRGVNLNPGQEPDDMVSLRFWIEPGRVITAWARPVVAVDDVRGEIEAGHAPHSVGQLVVALAQALITRIEPVMGELDDQLDALEERVIEDAKREIRAELLNLRRQAVTLRRYIASQREALSALILAEVDWLTPKDRERLHDLLDRNTRYVEDLDTFRERASILQDELTSRIAERMDRLVFRLSLVATLFLPLSFVTGLLGINVGGIPGASNPYGFYIVAGLLVAVLMVMLWLFRRSQLLK